MKTQAYATDRWHRNEEVGVRVKFNLKIKKKKSHGRNKDEECRIVYICSNYVISLRLDPKVGDRKMGKRERETEDCFSNFSPSCENWYM